MAYMRARTPTAARRLMIKYGASNAPDLIKLLPRPRRPSLRSRLRSWLMRLEGAQRVDPMRKEYKKILRSNAGVIPGLTRGRLK